MNDAAWKAGMKRLLMAFPYPTLDLRAAKEREKLYREKFGYLADSEWLRIVEAAVDNETDHTFPSVGKLREYADVGRPALKALPPARSSEQREADREIARRGVELIRRAAEGAGLVLPKAEPRNVTATEERKAELRQALAAAEGGDGGAR